LRGSEDSTTLFWGCRSECSFLCHLAYPSDLASVSAAHGILPFSCLNACHRCEPSAISPSLLEPDRHFSRHLVRLNRTPSPEAPPLDCCLPQNDFEPTRTPDKPRTFRAPIPAITIFASPRVPP